MKIAEIKLPDDWEPWACDRCPFFYLGDTEDGLEEVCVLRLESSDCPVKVR